MKSIIGKILDNKIIYLHTLNVCDPTVTYYIRCKCAIYVTEQWQFFFYISRGRGMENIKGKRLGNIGSVEVPTIDVSKKLRI